MKENKLQIVISSKFYGGVGGNERHLKAIIESMPENEFYVFAEHVFSKGFVPLSNNHYLNKPLDKNKIYDIYIYLKSCSPDFIGDQYEFKRKVIVQCGNDVFEQEHLFDYIFMQGKNGSELCKDQSKCRIVFSNPELTWPDGFKEVKGLPDKFFLTVFNPLGITKGVHVIYMVAKYSKLPIVWCYDDSTGWDFNNVPHMDNVIQFKNLSQEEIYDLYRKARAYICFSLSEGYGWSIADAFMFDLPIISRDIGIVTMIKNQTGIYMYQDEQELKNYISQANFIKPEYNKSIFSDYSYERIIHQIVPES